MYHVLVPVDENVNRALTQTACVASFPAANDHVTVTVTHARESTGKKLRPIREVDAVDRAVNVFEREEIPVEVTPCEKPAADGIVDTAEALDVDHVVMGFRKPSPVKEVLFGSTTKAVFRHTNVPVTVTGPGIEHRTA
jgi:nucleotide-binding universal stress UspA family protein